MFEVIEIKIQIDPVKYNPMVAPKENKANRARNYSALRNDAFSIATKLTLSEKRKSTKKIKKKNFKLTLNHSSVVLIFNIWSILRGLLSKR